MAKIVDRVEPIKITDNKTGNVYVLDFTRDTVVFAEDKGFSWDRLGDMPGTYLPLIWYTAFRRYDPRISLDKTTEILERLGGMKSSWITRLKKLYDQALVSLIAIDDGEPSEEEAKNAEMTVEL